MAVEKVARTPIVRWTAIFMLAVCVVGFGVAPFLSDAKAAINLISVVGILLAVVFYALWNYGSKLFVK